MQIQLLNYYVKRGHLPSQSGSTWELREQYYSLLHLKSVFTNSRLILSDLEYFADISEYATKGFHYIFDDFTMLNSLDYGFNFYFQNAYYLLALKTYWYYFLKKHKQKTSQENRKFVGTNKWTSSLSNKTFWLRVFVETVHFEERQPLIVSSTSLNCLIYTVYYAYICFRWRLVLHGVWIHGIWRLNRVAQT